MTQRLSCFLAAAIACAVTYAGNDNTEHAAGDLQVLDFRYAPVMEQACIGLPDDPFKSIVGCDKAKANPGIYYDYNKEGPFMGFQTRILACVETEGSLRQISQRIEDPRAPIVIIEQNKGGLNLIQEVWASAPKLSDVKQWSKERADYLWLKLTNQTGLTHKGSLSLQIDSPKTLVLDESKTKLVHKDNPQKVFCVFDQACKSVEYQSADGIKVDHLPAIKNDWATPRIQCAELFNHVMTSQDKPLLFSYPAKKCKIAMGFIEGYHNQPGIRPLEIQIEEQKVRTVDLVKEYGRNVPAILSFAAEDQNDDGVIEFGVYPVEGAEDTSPVLSAFWIFDESAQVNEKAILTGASDGQSRLFVNSKNIALSKTNSVKLVFKEQTLAAGGQEDMLVKFLLGEKASVDVQAEEAKKEQKRTIEYWQNADLPYDRIQVPDKNMQALLDSCIRNIYQAREIKDNLPAFQVGPTRYRGLWVVDGAFIMEAVSYLGRIAEARGGIQYLLSFQREDGAFMLIDGHWKEVGIVLWAISRHAHLSGDKDWLESVWPKVEKGIAFIEQMRKMPAEGSPNAGLTPEGYSDGGLGGKYPEYTNVYWTLAGYKSAIEAAKWLGKGEQAQAWQKQYDDLYVTFRKAADRDMKIDTFGNRFLPIRMVDDQNVPGQKAQWAFLHAVFPGNVFAQDDPLVKGNMAMLKANEIEGLVRNTGWVKDGLWGYFGSFYGHAWLWLGDGQKSADTLYSFANHASPMLVWREEQKPVGETEDYCGDMPHNWASAELIRMVRHSLVLERGNQLHLLEGLPSAWTKAGNKTQLIRMPTIFGDMDLRLQVARDGKSAELNVVPPAREKPAQISVHLKHFSSPVQSVRLKNKELIGKVIEIPADRETTLDIVFK